jgi:hypothetical protein
MHARMRIQYVVLASPIDPSFLFPLDFGAAG